MFSRREGLSARFRNGIPLSHAFCRTGSMGLLLRIPFFRLPLTCRQDEEISSVVFLLTCFSSRCASRGPMTIILTCNFGLGNYLLKVVPVTISQESEKLSGLPELTITVHMTDRIERRTHKIRLIIHAAYPFIFLYLPDIGKIHQPSLEATSHTWEHCAARRFAALASLLPAAFVAV
jgi:hypothetical protein